MIRLPGEDGFVRVEIFLRAPQPGERIRNPDLARTLFREYAAGLGFPLDFQGFEDELAALMTGGCAGSRTSPSARATPKAGAPARVATPPEIAPHAIVMNTNEELRVAFEEQARALAAGDPDALVVETMSDQEEAVLAVSAEISACGCRASSRTASAPV